MDNFPTDFLRQISKEYALSKEQEDVFVLRFGEESATYEEITRKLCIKTKQATIQRMSLIYKKFRILGGTRGKEASLRELLNDLAKKQSNISITNDKYLENQDPSLLLEELSQKIKKEGTTSIFLSLSEFGSILPALPQWIACRSCYTELEIAIYFIKYFQFICEDFTNTKATSKISSDIKSINSQNSQYINGILELLSNYKEKIVKEIENNTSSLEEEISNYIVCCIKDIKQPINKDFLKYLQTNYRDELSQKADGKIYIETLINILSIYIQEKIQKYKNAHEIGRKFSSFNETIKELLHFYGLVVVHINNMLFKSTSRIDEILIKEEIRKIYPSAIIESILSEIKSEILIPVQERFREMCNQKDAINKKDTVKLRDKLIETLEEWSINEEKIKAIVKPAFDKYQQDIIEQINNDICALRDL